MSAPVASSRLPSTYDAFLFARIGDADGGSISVLSLLARQNLDPWHESAKLAGLTRPMAVTAIAVLLRIHSGAAEDAVTAEALRLAVLLRPTRVTQNPSLGSAASGGFGFALCLLVLVVILGAFGLQQVGGNAEADTRTGAVVVAGQPVGPVVGTKASRPAPEPWSLR